MSTDEIIEYLTTYIKACKIKGNPFIVVYMGYLYLLDEMMSALYIVEIDHANNLIIATTYKEMVDKKNIGLNFAIYNNVGAIIHNYISFPKEKFSRLTRTDTDYEIPSRSTDNAKLTKYYLDNDPTKTILVPEFYGMVPIAKSDTYEMFVYIPKSEGITTSILGYVVHKKKPNVTITIYRRMLNLE